MPSGMVLQCVHFFIFLFFFRIQSFSFFAFQFQFATLQKFDPSFFILNSVLRKFFSIFAFNFTIFAKVLPTMYSFLSLNIFLMNSNLDLAIQNLYCFRLEWYSLLIVYADFIQESLSLTQFNAQWKCNIFNIWLFFMMMIFVQNAN